MTNIGNPMQKNNLAYWLAVSHLPYAGPRTILKCLEYCGAIENLFKASPVALRHWGLHPKSIAALTNYNWKMVDLALHWAEQSEHHILTWQDVHYPECLRHIYNPPLVLYIQGQPEVTSHLQIAIVGAREASQYGIKQAIKFSQTLVAAGLTITSGLALGIDRACHQAVLAVKGITIGVAATGLHHIYPKSNHLLVKQIIDSGGAILSEFPLSQSAHATHFPKRNRIISGLSIGVLIVEAYLKSGSLITARHALEQGREVFALPGSIDNPLTEGCHYLIRQGATLVDNPTQIVETLSLFKNKMLAQLQKKELHQAKLPSQKEERFSPKEERDVEKESKNHVVISKPALDLPPALQLIYGAIEHEITSIDMILLRTGLTANEVSSMLLSLELQGWIDSVLGGYCRKAHTS